MIVYIITNMRTLLMWIAAALAMTPRQAEMTREAMVRYRVPQFSVIVDGVQTGTYAFTDADRRHTYIDYKRFIAAPTSLRNVLDHEANHLLGRDHNSVGGDPMSYRLTVDPDGNVVEDSTIWAA